MRRQVSLLLARMHKHSFQARETKVVVDYGFALVVFTTDSSANAAGFDAIALYALSFALQQPCTLCNKVYDVVHKLLLKRMLDRWQLEPSDREAVDHL